MKRNDLSLHIAIGMLFLAIASQFVQVNHSIIAGISIATLLFTIAQTIGTHLSYLDDDTQSAMDVANRAGILKMSEENMLMFKALIKYDTSNKKRENLKKVTTLLNCLAFSVLFVGFVIPVSIDEKLSSSITVLSASLLFFSMWLVEKQTARKELWNEVLMLSLIQHPQNQCITADTVDCKGSNQTETVLANEASSK